MYTLHSRSKRAVAKHSALPHWPAPVSVVSRVDALGLVVVRLGHRGVGLVGAGRRHRLVLVVDAGRRPERLFEAPGPHERRRPPQAEDVEHLSGDVDPGLGGDLLADQRHREERGQVVGADRLAGRRVQRGSSGAGRCGATLNHASGTRSLGSSSARESLRVRVRSQSREHRANATSGAAPFSGAGCSA